VPRKTRVVQKSRHSSLARPRPSATLGLFDWIGHPPDHADEPKATPTGPFSQHSDVWMDDKELDLTADADDAELYGADETEPLWTGALEDEAKEDRESVPGDDDLVRRYLSEMGGFARLTPAEEVALAKRIEQGRSGKRRQPSSRKTPLLRRTQEAAEAQGTLWTDRLDSDQARAHMIRANLRLVVSIAKQFSGRGLALLDLIQEGNLGLMKAVDRFDWRRGCRFGTYASWWIKQSISRGSSDQGRSFGCQRISRIASAVCSANGKYGCSCTKENRHRMSCRRWLGCQKNALHRSISSLHPRYHSIGCSLMESVPWAINCQTRPMSLASISWWIASAIVSYTAP